MNAEIVAIGTELLLGQITDTNSTYLSSHLAEIGVDVYFRQTVGDNLNRVVAVLREALERSDVVICTGGLGPTDDDVTRRAAAQVVDEPLELDERYLKELEQWFAIRGHEMTDNNRTQAYRPAGSEFIPNERGTAPGIWATVSGKVLACLPGPPGEMRPMFREFIVPRLLDKMGSDRQVLAHRILKVVELGESRAEDRIKDIIALQTNPTIAPYAKGGEVQLRVTAKAHDEAEAAELIRPVEAALRERLGDYVYGIDDQTLASVIGSMLRERGFSLALAESCTGGLVGHRITQVPGSSDYFMLGIVSYSNEAKRALLGVQKETLEQFGAVSAETAREMAEGAARRGGTDCAIATTGIAGPGGGTTEKPVGTVWFGIHTPAGTTTHHALFRGSRNQVKIRTAQQALILLRRALLALPVE